MRILRGNRPQSGQAIIETALVLPIFLMLLSMAIDVDRFISARSQVEAAAHRAGRALTLEALKGDDCAVLEQAQEIAPGLSLRAADDRTMHSGIVGQNPAPWTAILYIDHNAWPTTTCPPAPSTPARAPGPVTAVVTYTWVPQSPLLGLNITIVGSATENLQY